MNRMEVSGELECYNNYNAVIRFRLQDIISYSAPVSPSNCGSRKGTHQVKLTAIFDDEQKLLAVDNIQLL